MAESPTSTTVLLESRDVLYCAKCGMPPEYCEYGPDFETHCAPWLKKHHPELFEHLKELRGNATVTTHTPAADLNTEKPAKPDRPWTTQERLTAFYEKYQPDKVNDVPSLLDKYAGKEDKLFLALTKKYGPEPDDPYYVDSDDDDSDDDDDDDDDDENNVGQEEMADLAISDKKKRRGAGAKKKKSDESACRVVVQKRAQNKRRILTVVLGMETVHGIKLKDVSKAFSKKFAGSSSVKDGANGKDKEIIIQGDHMYDVAEMIVDEFKVPDSAVFLDIDGDVVPLR